MNAAGVTFTNEELNRVRSEFSNWHEEIMSGRLQLLDTPTQRRALAAKLQKFLNATAKMTAKPEPKVFVVLDDLWLVEKALGQDLGAV